MRLTALALASLISVAGLEFTIVVPAQAQAEAQLLDFNIPEQAAETGLVEFAKQAGIMIMNSTKVTASRRTNAVRGRFTVTEALKLLLRDTGLVAGTLRVSKSGRTYVAVAAAKPMTLPDAPAF